MTDRSTSQAEIGDTKDLVRQLLAEELKLEPASIGDTSDVRALPGVDSVKIVRVVAKIERSYGLEFDDDDIFQLVTIEDIAELILRTMPKD